MEWAITPVEWVFLGVAVIVTIPFVFLIRYILKELKKEEAAKVPQPEKPDENVQQ